MNTEVLTPAADSHSEFASLLRQLRRLASENLGQLTDEEICARVADVEEVGRLVDGMRSGAAGEFAERSRYELGHDALSYRLGDAKPSVSIEHLARVSSAEANRRIQLGTRLRAQTSLAGEAVPSRFPLIAAAVTEGLVGAESAAHIVKGLVAASRTAVIDDLQVAERCLVETAGNDGADGVKIAVSAWLAALDPDGAEPRDEQARARRGFWLGKEIDGISQNTWRTTAEETARLRALFQDTENSSQVRFLSDEDREATFGAPGAGADAGADGEVSENGEVDVTAVVDPRTRAQRDSDTLSGFLLAGLRATEIDAGTLTAAPGSGAGGASILRPTTTVVAVATIADLEAGVGVGWFEDSGEPVSIATITRLACGTGFQRMVLGNSGEVLYLGPKPRLFSVAQRLALALRDGGCAWPGCDKPPRQTEAHHIEEYSRGGPTDIDNAVLLCGAHHHMLHSTDFTIEVRDGAPHLRAPVWLDPNQMLRRMGRTRVTSPAGLRRRLGDPPGDHGPGSDRRDHHGLAS